jgi:GxxExxY protein
MTENEIAAIIVDAAYKIHVTLGPGLLESVYSAAMLYELRKRGLKVAVEQSIPVIYDGVQIREGFPVISLLQIPPKGSVQAPPTREDRNI